MNRRHFSAALLSAGAAGAALAPLEAALAQAAAAGPAEGRDYTSSSRPSLRACPPGKIEVLEFFSYACPHCSAFEPTLEAWEKTAAGRRRLASACRCRS